MTIQIPYRGIIEIVGDHDVGKTIAALQTTNNMKDVVFVDDDVKGEGTVRQMQEAGMTFDEYIDLAPLRLKLGNTPTADELLQYVVMPTIEKIISKKRKVIIWDTWRIVYQSARSHVERNQHKYNNVVTFRGNSPIIQGLISKVARMIEHTQMNKLKDVCDLLIITHHVKDNYQRGVVIGKIPESSATFSEVCNMRIWLRRNRNSKVPIMLFLKRPNTPIMKGGKLIFTNIVPLKVTPTDKHESIWDAIAEYEKNPIQSRKPREDETPTEDELAAISGTITPEQRIFIQKMIEYNTQLEEDLSDIQNEAIAEPVKITEQVPKNNIQLLSMAKSKFDFDMEDIEEIIGDFAKVKPENLQSAWEKIINEGNKIAEATKKAVTKKKK